MEIKYKSNPNYRRPLTTAKIMAYLLIALLVVYAFGLFNAYNLGGMALVTNAIVLMVVAVLVTLVTEAVWAKVLKQDIKKYILSSFGWITAVILVLCVKADTSPYAIGVATFIAIFFGKLVFGGFGQNIFNPAAVGRAVIISSFAGSKIADAMTGATPTAALSSAGWLLSNEAAATFAGDFSLASLFLGNYGGALGETSVLILVLCAIFLTVKEVIDWRVPAVYVGTIFLGTLIIGLVNGCGVNFALNFIMTGGIFFGAVFMLTDPVTNPTTRAGKIVFAGLAAIFTVLIRLFANLPEGVCFSILLANMLTPVIDKFFSCKQTDNEKKYNIGLPVFVLAVVVCVVCCGFGLSINDYKSPNAPGATFPAGPTVKLSDADDATVVSNDGNTYVISSKGFAGNNEFKVVVDGDKVKSVEMTSFGDTAGIGDMLDVPEFFAQFEGKTLNDEVDSYSGATFTSKSAFAAVKTALSGGSASVEVKDPVSNGVKIADGDAAEVISSEGNTVVVKAKGFAGDNEFTIEVAEGKIVSFAVTSFGDTAGIGDAIEEESFTSSFVGKGLEDSVDTLSGATYSSKSAIAAAKTALSGGSAETDTEAYSEKALGSAQGKAEVVSNDGNTYVVKAKGFDGDNEFTIEVTDGKIASFAVSAFNDTKGIGDAICDESFTSSFAGKGLSDEVDVCSGATYSSNSALAAARCALESAGN